MAGSSRARSLEKWGATVLLPLENLYANYEHPLLHHKLTGSWGGPI